MLTTPEEDWAIAHELAHQWWGDLVTCADWTHFWLNQGDHDVHGGSLEGASLGTARLRP